MIRAFSFGGGVQSTAVLVLAAQQALQYDAFLFANVGADSENPATLRYMDTVTRPFAQRWGINLIELSKVRRDKTPETLLQRLQHSTRSIGIPMRMSNGAPGNRQCTGDFKIGVVAKWLREHGATKSDPATVGLGISTDELHRARTSSRIAYELLEYPLLAKRLSRSDCVRLIQEAGLPLPPKSACWFCPFQNDAQWRQLKHDSPELFRREQPKRPPRAFRQGPGLAHQTRATTQRRHSGRPDDIRGSGHMRQRVLLHMSGAWGLGLGGARRAGATTFLLVQGQEGRLEQMENLGVQRASILLRSADQPDVQIPRKPDVHAHGVPLHANKSTTTAPPSLPMGLIRCYYNAIIALPWKGASIQLTSAPRGLGPGHMENMHGGIE